MSAESKFQEIAEKVSAEASAVKCSPEDYRNGLSIIIEFLEIDKKASEDE